MDLKFNNNPVVEKLKLLDLNNVEVQEIISLFDNFNFLGYISNIIKKGSQICRMRIIDVEKEKIPINSKELSYNPNPSSEYGRCHIINESIFYGSINTELIKNYHNIFFEVTNHSSRQKNRLYFVVSSWILQEDLNVIELGSYLKHSNCSLKKRNEFINNIPHLPYYKKVWSKQLDDFLSKEFSKQITNNFEYKISAAFSSYMFNRGIQGIIYPSVQTNGAGLNIALEKSVVDNQLITPNHAIFGVQYYRNKRSQDEITMNGDFDAKGVIHWQDNPKGYMDIISKKYFNGESDLYPLLDRVDIKNLD